VQWAAPDNGGSAITAYTITIRQSDGATYFTVNSTCNGASTVIVSSRTCAIPATTLTAAPFNLAWSSSVFAKVSATNVYGTSEISQAGNGAIIVTVPNAPINLANNAS
jgi:hypothetical protein